MSASAPLNRSPRATGMFVVTLVPRFARKLARNLADDLFALPAAIIAVSVLAAATSVAIAAASVPGWATDNDGHVFVPEGGRLDALDEEGQAIGPCPLERTEVDVYISGHFTRVDVTQTYSNPYDQKIEAVYTFPLSHRGAIDRMTMTVGDRVIQGEVKERDEARRTYQAARRMGHVASLLEQERPNIFTQSVANIEPEAEIKIQISYVEVLESVDGQYQFQFPTVVAPRYIPGQQPTPPEDLPPGLRSRRGLIVLAPAEITDPRGGDAQGLSTAWLQQHATPIAADSLEPVLDEIKDEDPRLMFVAQYDDGLIEQGVLLNNGIGNLGGRWFFCSPRVLPEPGEPFAVDTDQVPDASRITPMPVKPDQRAGHDIVIAVHIDTGGPGIIEIGSESHELVEGIADGSPQQATVHLKNEVEIPNRDFVLNWRLDTERIEEAILNHTGSYGDFDGGFFTLILEPPARVEEQDIRPRELIFVLDQSGSMSGERLADRSALDAAKDVINQAIDTMRAEDRFNIVSFQSTLDVLWDEPRANTEENRRTAQRYIDERQGGGGTEMRNAVLRALGAGPFRAHRPQPNPDGTNPMRIVLFVTDGLVGNDDAIIGAIREHAHETRVFTIGMSNSPNRHLLDEMARVGRGAVDYVLPHDDVSPIVQRFAARIATPVLTDIELDFAGLEVIDVLPSLDQMPDLFDFQPLVVHGRYEQPGSGALIIRGRTGAGPYERRIELELPAEQPGHDMIATLWAREKVGELAREDNPRDAIVNLGESFQIMTQFTSFVAVDRRRVTMDGEPMLIRVPIEFPKGMSWEGIFGGPMTDDDWAQQLRDDRGGFVSGLSEPLVVTATRDLSLPSMNNLRHTTQFGPVPSSERGRYRSPGYSPRFAAEGRLAGELGFPGGSGGGFGGGGFSFEGRRPVQSAVVGRNPISELSLGGIHITDGIQIAQPLQSFEDFPLLGMPEGMTLKWVTLPGIADDTRPNQLRELLGGYSDDDSTGADRLARVLHFKRPQAERTDVEGAEDAVTDAERPDPAGSEDLYILALSPVAEIIEPFAERLETGDEDAEAVLNELYSALEAEVPRIRRDLELYRVLEQPLYERVLTLQENPQAEGHDELLPVTVLLPDLEPVTLEALAAVGFEIEATEANTTFAIGRIAANRLEALALLEPVRRIELLQ